MNSEDTILDIKKQGNQLKKSAKKVAYSKWGEMLARIGYAIRGLIYFTMGLIAVRVSAGAGSIPSDQKGAIAAIGAQPLGTVLLIIVALGLAGYALWGIVRAVFDPLKKGTDAKGWAARAGYLASAIGYASLLPFTISYIINGYNAGDSSSQNETQSITAQILAMPLGSWIVVLAGVGFIAAGIIQGVHVFRLDYKEYFRYYALNEKQRAWIKFFGKYGSLARSIIFSLIGLFLVTAAIQLDPQEVRAIDGALLEISRQPYGYVFLGIIAIGLVSFGIYSFLSAVFFRIKRS